MPCQKCVFYMSCQVKWHLRAVNGVGWDISLGVEVLFLQFSTLSRLTWGFVSLAYTVSEFIFSSDPILEMEE